MKINFNLRNPSAISETPINLIIRYQNNKLVYPTAEKILPKYWNAKKQKVRQEYKGAMEFNARLNDLQTKSENVFRRFLNDNLKVLPTPEQLRELLNLELKRVEEVKPQKITLFDFINTFIAETPKRFNEKTKRPFTVASKKAYQNLFNILKDFQKTNRKYKKLDFEHINLEFYEDFKDYMTTKKAYSLNTIGSKIKVLKTFLNEATERGINTNVQFKSKRFIKPSEETTAIYLNVSELETLRNFDFSKNPRLERVRDLFLVGCWTGLRFSDFTRLRKEHIDEDGFIEIETQKTAETVSIPIHPTVKRILEQYEGNLPKALTNQKMNEYLKEVAKLAGLDKIESETMTKGGKKITVNSPKYELVTTHTARRSFATNQYLAGLPSLTIMKITGHRTETSFMRYIKITPKEHAIKLKELWESQANKQPEPLFKIA